MAKRVKPLLKAVVAGLCLCSPVPLIAQDIWAIGDSATVRVEPSRFDQLPTEIIRYLVELGCTIPQTYLEEGLHNVVAGEFRRHGQQDWAVLCSVDAKSRILVFFGGSLTDIADLAAADDRSYLQGIGNGEIGYSRYLQVAHAEYIMRQQMRYAAGTPLPPLNHDGIEDLFVEKGSVVHYLLDGKWLQLAGAD